MPYPLSKMIKRETDQNEEFSLVLGGPLYQLLLRSRLIEPPFGNLGWRIGVISALAWCPWFHSRFSAGASRPA